MFTKELAVKNILKDRKVKLQQSGNAFAPSNIALCKYWGKRDRALNLPINSSLSVSLGNLGTATEVKVSDKQFDELFLNNERVDPDSSFYQRIIDFVNLIRPSSDLNLKICTFNNIPTAAGLASSASGFAALTLALNELFGFKLSKQQMSCLARIGSGSACRSLYDGFVIWNKGEMEDGMDSFAEPMEQVWPELCIGVMEISTDTKKIGSREGMNRTVDTSVLYRSWQDQAENDIAKIITAITEKDFRLLGETAEHNACAMHATMLSAFPPVIYWKPESVNAIHQIHELRENGVPVYFTMDAGPNIKLIFEEEWGEVINQSFPELKIIRPFKV